VFLSVFMRKSLETVAPQRFQGIFCRDIRRPQAAIPIFT
jgi:hypothetical protein